MTNDRTDALIDALVINILIPELASWLRREPGLTDQQAIDRWSERREAIIATGRAFLDETEDIN